MSTHSLNSVVWASSPGATLETVLGKKHLTMAVFAERIGKTAEYVQKLMSSDEPISEELAKNIASATATPAEFWIKREAVYRKNLKAIAIIDREPEAKEWVKSIPLKELSDFQWLLKAHVQQSKRDMCLGFFGVNSIQEWHEKYKKVLASVRFKKSAAYDSKLGSVTSWLRQIEIKVLERPIRGWNPTKFKNSLLDLRKLTRKKNPENFLTEIARICASSGVNFVVLRTPKGSPASGVSWNTPETGAVLALSCRYLSDDHFWFTFFHEAAHLLLHGKTNFHIESDDNEFNTEEEEANTFSARVLIPDQIEKELMTVPLDHKSIIAFAMRSGLSAGIIVGQLQYRQRIRHSEFNFLKRRYSWV